MNSEERIAARRERLRGLLEFEKAFHGRGTLAGVDEAGRGPLAGPVVAAAVMFSPGMFIEGVDDSKKLTPDQREEMYAAITASALSIGVGIVDHGTIDAVNIANATYKAMHKAIAQLRPAPDHLLIDGNRFPDCTVPHTTIVDGDAKCFSIAAASIIAKVTRDRLMVDFDREYPGYGFGRHKGYGTKEHYAALERLGCCPIHRRTFLRSLQPADPSAGSAILEKELLE